MTEMAQRMMLAMLPRDPSAPPAACMRGIEHEGLTPEPKDSRARVKVVVLS